MLIIKGALANSVEILLARDVDGCGLVDEEGGSGSVGVVGGEGDHNANSVSSLLHQHRTAPLGCIHLERYIHTYTCSIL